MKNITYDLIEKLRRDGSGEEAEKRILQTETDPAWLYALSPNRGSLIEWYPWNDKTTVLLLGADCGAFCSMLSERVGALDVKDSRPENLEAVSSRCSERLRENGGNISLFKSFVTKKYDAVIIPEITPQLIMDYVPGVAKQGIGQYLAEGQELSREAEQVLLQSVSAFLKEAASYLREGGSLLFAADNAAALRYMTGAEQQSGQLYFEYERLRKLSGELPFAASKFYYPLPDGRLPKDIFSDLYLPKEGDFRGISDAYDAPRYLTGDEAAMYGRLCEAGAFPPFAPGYLLVLSGYKGNREQTERKEQETGAERTASAEHTAVTEHAAESSASELPSQIYIRYNRTRIPEYQTKTEIFEQDGVRSVKKTALSKAANDHILSLEWKYKLLKKDKSSALLVQEPKFTKEARGVYSASFDYLEGKPLSALLAEEIADGKAPVNKVKDALELVLGIGAHECHNMDCLFENVMKCGDSFYYLDYEWVFEHPVDRGFLRYRMLRYWYEAYRPLLCCYSDLREFLKEFGIGDADLADFEHMEESFQTFVHGDGQQSFIENFKQKVTTLSDIHETERRLSEFTEWNLKLQDEVKEHKETISKDQEVLRLSQNHILNIEKANRIHERDIANMQEELAYLRKHEALTSRIGRNLKKSYDAAFPDGSRKRKIMGLVKDTFRHPGASLRMYATEEGRNRIKGDFEIGGEYREGGRLTLPDCLHYADLFAGGAAGKNGVQTASGAHSGEGESFDVQMVSEAYSTDKSRSVQLPSGKIRPLVSIILPAYNQVAYTYACVRSIIAHTNFEETPYEVILADDVSTDATAQIGKFIRGMVICRNTENQGFLKNCNQAAKKALGEYIFFLNNDTKVTDGWLSSLVSLMERDPRIGMAGSKLIYPDGRLQEAGGIIWSDASGWNYGRLDDPAKPEYNYVKEVDYISGAAIMIRKQLWEEIGGFDERFAPAYCEDSDLAFEVRKHGKLVVYQPQSVVVHFEGVSNGTDVNGTGLKKYQLVNQEKFKEKWKAELREQSKNTGNPNPFAARERSQKKNCVLYVDHYVPTWDKDAGSKTTYQYIRMLLEKGWQVKFLGDNFLHEEPYSTELQQMGVEILYGETMQRGIWDWIRKNQEYIDIAYLNRPHITIKYIDFLRNNTNIKCIYYGHDLHFMRLMREYELDGDIRTKREADYWKSIEFSVMSKADMSYYPSELEAEAIHAVDPKIRVKAITAYVWENFLSGINQDYAKREGLLFVGGFAHPPNADGILWFAEKIFPKIREQRPDIRLYVAGSKATPEVKALGEKPEESGIEVLGFVSDEELAALYQKTKITVVPLRYGAGVKGKVVEALYNGSVIVTTSVGAEGIPDASKVLATVNEKDSDIHEKAAETEQSFADAVLKLYGDDKVLASISAETQDYIREYYSLDAAWKVIAPDFAAKKKFAETPETERAAETDPEDALAAMFGKS